MNDQSPTPNDARRFVVEPSDVELWRIGLALDRTEAPLIGDVPPALVADMLEVGEPENWERTTREITTLDEFFHPYSIIQKEDGRCTRSWLPEDLSAEDESRLRALATASKNEFVRARLFEILWDRFESFPDAGAAIDARFACAHLLSGEDDWPRLVANLGRLTTLTMSLSQHTRFPALVTALDEAASRLVASAMPFRFPDLADMVCNTLLTKPSGRDAFTVAQGKAWDAYLGGVASRYAGDPHHGHDSLMVLQAWRARWGDQDGATSARRQVVANLQAASKAGSSLVATTLAQRALQAALDFGLSDLSRGLRNDLMGAIKRAIPAFKQVSGTLTIPKELLATIDLLLASSPRLPGALRQLSVLPGLLEVDVESLRETAREQLRQSPFAALVPTEHYHLDGKVTFRSNDFDGNVERHVASLIGCHLVFVEALLRYFLANAASRLKPSTLTEALASWPHLPPHRAALLTVAAERFASGDFISSGVVVLTVYEAVLRDLLRAIGYPALKVERGVQMDETLNSLLRGEAAREILGAGYCDLAEYVLCEPALGWNLRNEVAHGTVRPDSLSPTRVLVVWLLLLRITCFTRTAPDGPDPAPSSEVEEPTPDGSEGSS